MAHSIGLHNELCTLGVKVKALAYLAGKSNDTKNVLLHNDQRQDLMGRVLAHRTELLMKFPTDEHFGQIHSEVCDIMKPVDHLFV